jgi:hypothetical protein
LAQLVLDRLFLVSLEVCFDFKRMIIGVSQCIVYVGGTEMGIVIYDLLDSHSLPVERKDEAHPNASARHNRAASTPTGDFFDVAIVNLEQSPPPFAGGWQSF